MRHFIAALALMAGPAMAATLGEEDGIVINRLGGADFEVVQGTNFGAAEFWCGAGSFVERRQGMAQTTPIYLKRARGPAVSASGRQGVVFSTSAAGLPAAGSSSNITVDVPGTMLSAAKARSFCRDAFNRSTK